MNLPPFFTGITLLFWGWEAHLWPVALGLALLLELRPLVRWRWDFSATDMNRLWDLCGLLFLLAAIFAYATTDLVSAPARFMPWLPMIFFPFTLALAYSAEDRVRLSTFFWLLRRKNRRFAELAETPGQGRFWPYGYLLVCFTATSMVNARDARFYVAIVVLGAWLLWGCRSRTAPRWGWLLLLLLVAGLGLAGSIGLTRLQALVESALGRALTELAAPENEIAEARTAMGMVGRLKLSGQVVLRLETDGTHPPPELLRKGSFDLYTIQGQRVTWAIARSEYQAVLPSGDAAWVLAQAATNAPTVAIAMRLPGGLGVLPMPDGPARLANLPAVGLQTNTWGTVRVRESLPFVRYRVAYTGLATLDGPPTEHDLVVPEIERPALAQIATELNLASRPPAEVLRRVNSFFDEQFHYREYVVGTGFDVRGQNTPLRQFLTRDRAGHCEYFATAATLLLRQAGIPARYAIGFAVVEGASRRLYRARARHAHAWTLAYVDGAWRNFDATPGGWVDAEKSQRSPLEPVTDFVSALIERFQTWRYYGERGALARRALWLSPVLVLWFLWRLFSKKRQVRLATAAANRDQPPRPGADSEFYRIERHLADRGLPRRPGETLPVWITRLELAHPPALAVAPLRSIVVLHYAYRFDPRGVPERQREDLRAQVAAWLATPMTAPRSHASRGNARS